MNRIKTILIVSVTSLNLAVVPRSSWANELAMDMVFRTKLVQWMGLVGLFGMRKFTTIIRLYGFRSIAEKGNCTYYKVDSRVAAIFFVSIDKTLA